MKSLSSLKPQLRNLAKAVARQTVGRLPRSPKRLTGKLAINGGMPVRDVRFRPWRSGECAATGSWSHVGPRLKSVFQRGVEGLPQPLAKEFAKRWADYCGCRYALLLPHGTDALRIALASAMDHDGLTYGGEIIVPNFSFIASATSALDRRMGVALVDVEPETLLLDPRRVEEAIVPGKTKAIMAVHLFGQPANMAALRGIAVRHNLKLIEDAAQAHGSSTAQGPVGSLGDVAGFSFQSFKNLSCGEGGALTTNDEQIIERAYLMHDVGRPRVGGDRWKHLTLGWNCRPTEYQAALLLERFPIFKRAQERRRASAAQLRELLADVPCIEPLEVRPGVTHGMHMFGMRYRPEHCDGVLVADFLRAVQAEGSPAARGYTSTMAQQPVLQKVLAKHPDYLRLLPTPVADQAVNEIIFIPQHIFLGPEAEMREIAATFRKVQRFYAPQARRSATSVPAVPATLEASATAMAVVEKAPRLRCGVVGAGVMGRYHIGVIAGHPLVCLTAIADPDVRSRSLAAEQNCAWFATPDEMLRSGKIDVVVIATPHWQHANISIAALRQGLHVICEKPLTVTASQADAVLTEAAKARGLFSVVHQNRFEPAYAQAKRILESGELGPILRCTTMETMWRPESYYKDSPWRGTWKGEGGGVLLNQAPHMLDRYLWLCGMPEAITGQCSAAMHAIEVEDTASAILFHAGGWHGHIHASTAEYPATSQFVIACDRGRLQIDKGVLRVTRLPSSIREVTLGGKRSEATAEGQTREISTGHIGSIPELLTLYYENIALSVLGKEQLVCPGAAGRAVVEMANGIILSSYLGQNIQTPVDRAAYDAFMQERMNPLPSA